MKFLTVAAAAEILRDGELVVLPTETVYGLAADATNPIAVDKIYRAKNRPHNHPLIVHLAEAAQITEYCLDFPKQAQLLTSAFGPGPITLVLRRKPGVLEAPAAGLETIAVRIPSHPTMREVLKLLGRPIAAPSANTFSHLSPTKPSHVEPKILTSTRGIVDGGPCEIGVESTIISLVRPDHPKILRLGSISLEEISSVLPLIDVAQTSEILSPGMQKKHYSPKTPMKVYDSFQDLASNYTEGSVAFSFMPLDSGHMHNVFLSSSGSFREASRNFFSKLHEIDNASFSQILALRFPDTDLGRTLNDKLTRAAHSE